MVCFFRRKRAKRETVQNEPPEDVLEEVVPPEAVVEQTEDVEVPPEAVLEEVVQSEDVEVPPEAFLEEIPALGRAVGRPTESDAKKIRSMTEFYPICTAEEQKTSKGKTKKKKISAKSCNVIGTMIL